MRKRFAPRYVCFGTAMRGTLVCACFLWMGVGGMAAHIHENFEGLSPRTRNSLPEGWRLVRLAGSPACAATVKGLGSEGTGERSGIAVDTGTSSLWNNDKTFPAGFVMSTTVLDLSAPIYGRFDFQLIGNGDPNGAVFMMGDIANGIKDDAPGEALLCGFSGFKPGETPDKSKNKQTLEDNTWYQARFCWIPTSGTQGELTIAVSDFKSDVFSVSAPNYKFAKKECYFGFGAVKDAMRIDNVCITGSLVGQSSAAR